MEDLINNIPTILFGGLAALIMSGVTLYFARKAGLTDIQEAVKNEASSLIDIQDKKIERLEERVKELEAKCEELERKSTDDEKLIYKLRKIISDREIEIHPWK